MGIPRPSAQLPSWFGHWNSLFSLHSWRMVTLIVLDWCAFKKAQNETWSWTMPPNPELFLSPLPSAFAPPTPAPALRGQRCSERRAQALRTQRRAMLEVPCIQ